MKKPTSKRPAFPGRFPKMKTFSDERGVSPVIAVILMVAITVVLASVLYIMLTSIVIPPPKTNFDRLDCKKGDEPGEYILTYHGSREHSDIVISLIDEDTNAALILDPETETYKEIPEGISLSYLDVNSNGKLDSVDRLVVEGGAEGDEVSVADANGENAIKCTLE